ncbi:MAG: hypothetical protein M1824_002391 [Vezdaea acicularis]|nr:MAG: hypothetical protein M1824_002391 [Vezdaea acicularis]
MSTHLSPSALFSPSTARIQLAQAKDWNYIDTWLTQRFGGKPAPPFERNPETLKALLALAAWNEAADEERDVVGKLERKVCKELKVEMENDPNARVLAGVEESLTLAGAKALETLGSLATALSVPTAPTSFALAIGLQSLTKTQQLLAQQVERVVTLQASLDNSLTSLKRMIEDLHGPTYAAPPNIQKHTQDWQRGSKQLSAKLVEYKERLASMPKFEVGVTIEEVEQRERELTDIRGKVKEVEGRVNAYEGLPPEKEAAIREVEKVRKELRREIRRRDRLFEGLVEDGERG